MVIKRKKIRRKLAGKAYDMTIKSPAKIIKQVVYISKDVTDVVIKGMIITSKLIITFLSVVSISIMTLVACIYKCNLMHRIKNKICYTQKTNMNVYKM